MARFVRSSPDLLDSFPSLRSPMTSSLYRRYVKPRNEDDSTRPTTRLRMAILTPTEITLRGTHQQCRK